ncbi:MAG TPA: hypothetical protein V6D10_23635 [Trichocoleus sp.]|jgi:transposase-like protein
MAPRKLSESDKQDILKRYRQSDETAASLANQYSVSTSTVSRLLKQTIPDQEYEALVQQKRSGASRQTAEQDLLPGLEAVEVEVAEPALEEAAATVTDETAADTAADTTVTIDRPPSPARRQRQRLQIEPIEKKAPILLKKEAQLELPTPAQTYVPDANVPGRQSGFEVSEDLTDLEDEDDAAIAAQTVEDLDEEIDDDEADDLLEDDLDDDDLDDDDLDDLDEGDEDDVSGLEMVHLQGRGAVRVLPFSEAPIPKTCYVVVDRSSELITRPLKDFADLGQIPFEETQEKTLPIFDNHRVAKRFLRRMQRIVKLPDGRVLQKVQPYLQAKGITRLLIDGQVYSL